MSLRPLLLSDRQCRTSAVSAGILSLSLVGLDFYWYCKLLVWILTDS